MLQPFRDESYSYRNYVNPEWVKLLSILGLNRQFTRSLGAELYSESGEVFLDFLSGYGVYNAGHNHPYIIAELIDELQSQRPSMLQSTVCTLAGELAQRLCEKAGGRVEKVYFGSSGSEGVESAIKFSRAYTGRDWILYADGGFHGLTCGALSLMSNPWWRKGFGPLLAQTQGVPFGDLAAAKKEIASERYAAIILEPIQGENGVRLPPEGYLQGLQDLCDQHGTLFVLDEVQTGVHRTGPFLASQHYNVTPDMVILAKALSGGHVPVGALLMRDDICRSVYTSVDKAFVHTSTFSENTLAMRAGLATLDVVERENLGERSTTQGIFLRQELTRRLANFDFIKEVRGLGLFNAIEFQAPRSFQLKVFFHTFAKAHAGLFGQMIIKTLFDQGHVLSQMAGNDYLSIKSLPPLVVSQAQITSYAEAVQQVCAMISTEKTKFWRQGVEIAAKAFSAKLAA
jgi:ornithine--oxo-acid transaminase